jgi:DNA-binding LytR/AlgR family response regulator
MNNNLVIGVIEDELIIAASICSTLEKIGHSVLPPAHTYEQAMDLLTKNEVDLYLVDININNKPHGIEIGQRIHEEIKKPFIYITAYTNDENIEAAKKTQPDAFIVKPPSYEQLKINIELAYAKHQTDKALPINTTKNAQEDQFFMIKDGYDHIKVQVADILYVENDRNYVTYYFENKKKLMERNTISSVIEYLEPMGFIRVNRTFIINIEKIEKIETSKILMEGGKIIKVKASVRDQLLKIFISTLWFFLLPTVVELSAIGCNLPYPL